MIQTFNTPNACFAMCALDKETYNYFTNKNIPNIVGQFTTCLGKSGININDLSHKNLDQIGYTILIIDKPPEQNIIDEISNIEGVIKITSIG